MLIEMLLVLSLLIATGTGLYGWQTKIVKAWNERLGDLQKRRLSYDGKMD